MASSSDPPPHPRPPDREPMPFQGLRDLWTLLPGLVRSELKKYGIDEHQVERLANLADDDAGPPDEILRVCRSDAERRSLVEMWSAIELASKRESKARRTERLHVSDATRFAAVACGSRSLKAQELEGARISALPLLALERGSKRWVTRRAHLRSEAGGS